MLSIETLIKKPQTINQNNEQIVDFTAATFIYKRDVRIIGSGIVSDELEMRPDLVARIYYGDVSKLDYILKFNGISNPFSLEKGTTLIIGDQKEMEQNLIANSGPEKKQDIRSKFFDKNRLSKKDSKRLELMQEKSKEFTNGASNLPPNMADIGSTEVKVKDGVVVFGGDVVANKDNCPEVLSRAKVKAKLLENKIFKNS
jgi:hypothetical protein